VFRFACQYRAATNRRSGFAVTPEHARDRAIITGFERQSGLKRLYGERHDTQQGYAVMAQPPNRDPQEIPPPRPGQPAEPPQESPPGNPRPDIPPPLREPGAPAPPQELPPNIPDELPVRGPGAPSEMPPVDPGVIDLPGSNPDVLPGTPQPPSI
jgi:hypothetical protein